jgi:hypothetical protein
MPPPLPCWYAFHWPPNPERAPAKGSKQPMRGDTASTTHDGRPMTFVIVVSRSTTTPPTTLLQHFPGPPNRKRTPQDVSNHPPLRSYNTNDVQRRPFWSSSSSFDIRHQTASLPLGLLPRASQPQTRILGCVNYLVRCDTTSPMHDEGLFGRRSSSFDILHQTAFLPLGTLLRATQPRTRIPWMCQPPSLM